MRALGIVAGMVLLGGLGCNGAPVTLVEVQDLVEAGGQGDGGSVVGAGGDAGVEASTDGGVADAGGDVVVDAGPAWTCTGVPQSLIDDALSCLRSHCTSSEAGMYDFDADLAPPFDAGGSSCAEDNCAGPILGVEGAGPATAPDPWSTVDGGTAGTCYLCIVGGLASGVEWSAIASACHG